MPWYEIECGTGCRTEWGPSPGYAVCAALGHSDWEWIPGRRRQVRLTGPVAPRRYFVKTVRKPLDTTTQEGAEARRRRRVMDEAWRAHWFGGKPFAVALRDAWSRSRPTRAIEENPPGCMPNPEVP